ncbi:hypothetical protein VB779_15635 [Haloarculaceae archaeon H-GB11]|nr:hypothetical protein [Haloarculaceae archaeon H-GB11]
MKGERVDPDDLPDRYTPAIVQIRGQGPVFVADYVTLDSGWLRVTEWTRGRAKLPPHRVSAVREVRTEYHGEPHQGTENRPKRIVDDEWREEARDDDMGGKAVVADD